MAAHHRHQISLEQVLDFSAQPSLTVVELAQAGDIFNKLISHCEPLQSRKPHKKVTLVRLTYEHSRSKDTFLRHFFNFLDTKTDQGSSSFVRGLSRFSTFGSAAPARQKSEAEGAVDSFAEYLFDNFFLPYFGDEDTAANTGWFVSDGTAELGHIVSLKLGGWLDGVAA